MSLLGDSSFKKDCPTIEHFEKALTQLLQAHANCQKKIVQLTEENKQLKRRLTSLDEKQPSSTTEKNKLSSLDSDLINQINQYIKEIDLCLAYFEQA